MGFLGIIVRKQSAAILVSLQRHAIEIAVKIVCVQLCADQLGKFAEQTDPGVQIGGAVVAVHHRHGLAGGRGHHVDLGVDLL